MEMTGEYRIPAPREKVWEALNDPEVLKKCIPGCQELNKDSETELSAKVKSKVGPVSATFTGKVTLSDIDPPKGYRISGEGTGGVAGFAKGGAVVNLVEDGAETVLTYNATAQVGGKLAQIGSRLIDSTAKKMANEFFGKFASEVGDANAVATPAVGEASGPAVSQPAATPAPDPSPAAAQAAPAPAPSPSPSPAAAPKPAPSAADAATAAAVPTEPQATAADAGVAKADEIAKTGGGLSPAVWVGGLIAAVIVVLVLLNI
ncbi:MAG: carbon monoxide dehydrogenase subunit G [Rhodospirillaceae bacterium]